MNTLLLLIATYLGITTYLGFRAQRQSQFTADDYFLAGRSVGWIHLGVTFFATWFSTLAFLAVAGFNFSRGISWYFAQGSFWMLAPVVAWVLGRRIWVLGKLRGYVTPGDFFADIFQSRLLRVVVGLLSLFALLPYILVQLVGIGKVFEAVSNGSISYTTGVSITALATAFYTAIGGVRAVIWTDLLQGLLFLGVTILGVYVAASAAGGVATGFATAYQLRPELFSVDVGQLGVPLTTILIWTPGVVVLPHLWQRTYMAESEVVFSKSLVVLSVMSLMMLFATMSIGILSVGVFESLTDSDTLIPLLFRQHAPNLLPLLVLATFAAGMSTIDSQLITAASVMVRDILPRDRNGDASERNEGRAFVIALIVAAWLFAQMPQAQGAIFTLASEGTALAFLLFAPLLAALYGRVHSASCGLTTLMVGLVTYLPLRLYDIELPLRFGPPVAAFLMQMLVLLLFHAALGFNAVPAVPDRTRRLLLN